MALLISFVLVLAMGVTAFASETGDSAGSTGNNTITINNAAPAQQHTYEAYQVFSGSLEDGKLTKLDWGTGVDGAAILAELISEKIVPEDTTTAQQVADIIGTYSDKSAQIDAFASIVGKHTTTAAATSTGGPNTYTLSGLTDGYYFVKDKDESVTAEGETYSKYMLNVVDNVTIDAKDEHLKSDKKIVEGEDRVDTNTAAIGDTITYEITVPIPKMDGYKSYFFQMQDTMDPGLTFQEVTSIKIGDEEIIGKTDKYVIDTDKEESKDHSDTLTITYNDFIQYKETSGSVVVTYTAVLNEFAKIDEPNNNTVHYKYSNNPGKTEEGKPDGGDDVTGKTPDSETHTWVTQLELLKTGDNGKVEALAGAGFTLEGKDLNVVVMTGNEFIESAEGDYYKLKDGTYTKTEATDATREKYESTTTKYKLENYEKVKTEAGEGKNVSSVTGTDGKITFTGLKPGTYTLKEDFAPSGYNVMDPNPITFSIKWDEKEKKFTVDNNNITYDESTHTFKITVDDKSGATLPSTGGMGTTIFYVLGGVLVLGAAIALISKRRMAEG